VRHITIVGASLLAMAVYQSTTMLDLMASSRAGSLLQGAMCATSLLWEPACWRWRCISPRRCWIWWPHREQARSYREPCAPHYYCGSQPAGDGGVSINDDVGSDGLIASGSLLQGAMCATSLLWEPACWRWRCISPRRCWSWWPHRE